MSAPHADHKWTHEDTNKYLNAILEYPIRNAHDGSYVASKVLELSVAFREAAKIDDQTYDKICEISQDQQTYGENIRLAATQVLENYAMDHPDQASRVLNSLLSVLDDQSPVLRKKAIASIGAIGFSNDVVSTTSLELLREGLREENPDVIAEIVTWAGNIGHSQFDKSILAVEILSRVIDDSSEFDTVKSAIQWAGNIGKLEGHNNNLAAYAVGKILDTEQKFSSALGSMAVDNLAKIAAVNETYAGWTLPILTKAFSVRGSNDLHLRASKAIWTVGQTYPNLKVRAIQALSDVINDVYSNTRDSAHEGLSNLIDALEWEEFPGQQLRDIFTGMAKGESPGHDHAKDLLAQLNDSQRAHIDSLSPSVRSGLQQRR